MNRIDFDSNATTRPDPEVVEAMLPFLGRRYGNPSSPHLLGTEASEAIERARAQVARLLFAESPSEIVFTSCATESVHTAIRAALAARPDRRRIVTTKVEHSAVRHPLERCVARGYEVVEIGVDAEGRLDGGAFASALGDDCALATVLWVNNETGVVADLPSLAGACRERGVTLHVDAVQAAGKIPIRLDETRVDLLSISGHKFHGPKGASALYCGRGFPFEPLLGGPQESDRRAGTENVPAIVGLGVAATRAAAFLEGPGPTELGELRDELEQDLLRIPGTRVHGAGAPRVANTTSIGFENLGGEALTLLLSEEGLLVSTGAACSSGSQAPSHVLGAMGLSAVESSSTIRFSLSRFSTRAEVEAAGAIVRGAVEELRAIAPAASGAAPGPGLGG